MTLRAEISIVPFGVEEEKRKLRTFDIFNKGPSLFGHYAYGVIEIDHERGEAGLWDHEIFHRRHNGAEELVRKVLEGRQRLIEEAELLEGGLIEWSNKAAGLAEAA